jgi:hypothetical protein
MISIGGWELDRLTALGVFLESIYCDLVHWRIFGHEGVCLLNITSFVEEDHASFNSK